MKRALTVLVVVAMTLASVAAGTPTVDVSNDSSSASISDVRDGTAVQAFFGSRSNNTSIQFDNGTEFSEVVMKDQDNRVLYENSTPEAVNRSDGQWKFNESHFEWRHFPMDAGKNTTVTVELTNDSTIAFPDTGSFDVVFVAADNYTARFIDERIVETEGGVTDRPDDEVSSDPSGITVFGVNIAPGFTDASVSYSEETMTVGGFNSTVLFHVEDEVARDAFRDVEDGKEHADWASDVTLVIDGTPRKVYYNGTPPEVSRHNDTYGVVQPADDDIRVHLGDQYKDREELDLDMTINANFVSQLRAYGFRLVGRLIG